MIGPQREHGDVTAAWEQVGQRAVAATGDESEFSHFVGDAILDDTGLHGGAAEHFRLIYGDLFDAREFMEGGAVAVANQTIALLVTGQLDLFSALLSVQMQAAAIGALAERKAWERTVAERLGSE